MNLPAIKDKMDEYAKGLLYQIIPNKSFSNVCYTYRISNKLAGSVYKIALNDALPEELKEWLKTIEFCHIKRQHYAAKQTLDFRFSAPKIKAVYNRLKPLFDDPVSDIDNMYDIFEDYIFKMLRDWEVFTNDFTEDEVRYLDTLYPDECIIDGQPVIHLLPQDVGYPPGLTANEYLLLILQNPEQWFTNQMSAMQQAMDDLKQRKQNNGTQGGCNTNQSGATSSSGGADDMNHNKEDRERPKKNPPQNQQGGQNGQNQNGQNQNGQNQKGGQSGQQNQQPQNQQGGQNGQNQNGQDDQGMGSSQQNQDAAANTQQQEWKDGKDSNGGSNGSSGKQPNNDKSEQTNSSSKGSGKGGSDDKSEQDGQSGGGSSDGQEGVEDAGAQNESRSGGSSSDNDKGNSDDADGENQAGGSGTSDEDNGEDGSESESSNSGAAASDDTEDGEDTSGEASGEEGSETTDGQSSDDGSEGSEGSDGDASDAEGDSGERRELTKEELEELIKQFVQKAVSDYQKMLEIKDEQEADSDSLKGYSRDGGGGAGNGTVLVDKCTNWIDFEGLEKEIRELMINRCVTVSKRDLLYNYNRGRGCGDVLTPRYREQTTYDEVPMTVVLDVSGSISDKNILGFCNIFKNVSKTCGKKCKIVMWDTDLRAIYDSGDDIKAVSGGGTNIGAGIDYVRKNFQPSEIGNLFVVSDCEDDLEDWDLDGFEQPYLVCWSSMDVIEHYTGSLFNEFVDSFEKILVKK
jgi:hypothetical protein